MIVSHFTYIIIFFLLRDLAAHYVFSIISCVPPNYLLQRTAY